MAVNSCRSPDVISSGLVTLGVGYQWLYNGLNFLAFKVGGETFHPLMLAALRFCVAAALILPFAIWRWRLHPASARELAGAALLGPIMLIGSQTLAIWGTHLLPAGVASVFGSAAPVFLALFAWVFLRRAPSGRQLAGIALGLIGLAAMAWASSSGTGFRPLGAVITLTASAIWAAGSLGASRLQLPGDPAIGLAAQLLPTAVLLALTVWLTGISASLHPSAVPLRAWGVLAFLVVASTLIGYAVFLALNRSASSMLANSFNYVAPVIALEHSDQHDRRWQPKKGRRGRDHATNPERVVEITPANTEFEEEGAEYQILLRGDPASRASLLSTTIQTSMLLPRLLDPPGATWPSGAFGRRAFLFTDDLDVTNRLFDDLRDAEAYTIFGKPDPQRAPLANTRRGGGDAALRDVEGQRWRICEDIGHLLDHRLVVGRTTSQDAGVNQGANIVVATAALEVGFNDPLVGAVIQHKAPRSMASFLQRKGRAGRDRLMRPIMLTVLSDYGRDRAFYQAFEHLFDPTLEPQHLPIANPYVLKIQAVFALFDWLGARTSGYEKAWQWDILSRPLAQATPEIRAVLERTKTILTRLIRGEDAVIDDLRAYLGQALGISVAAVDTLLWEAPRSLLLEAVPTLARRLFRNWRLALPSGDLTRDLQVDYHPLPDFVPRTLFSDLALPEVSVIVPPATVNHDERIEGMPIVQALGQFAPGRVTRRFAHERGALSHWVPVDPALPEQNRRISDYAVEHEYVGTFTGRLNSASDDGPLLVFRPWTIRLDRAARSQALPNSNARLAWQSDIEANGDALGVPVPVRSAWHRHVTAVDFHLHRFRANVNVRRFARTVHANVRTLQDDFPVVLHFTSDDNQPAAVGFELEVDGFRVDVALPPSDVLVETALLPAQRSAARLAYLRDAFRRDPALPEDLNLFQRDWLFEFLVCALLAGASADDPDLQSAIDTLLSDDQIDGVFHGVMDALFGAVPPSLPDDDETEDADRDDEDAAAQLPAGGSRAPRGPGRLQQALLLHLGRCRSRSTPRPGRAVHHA